MAIEHISKFITDLAMHFSPPRFDQEHERQAWQKSIAMELRGSSPEVLERAARSIIQTRKNRYFPLVAECRQAVREAAELARLEGHLETMPALRQSLGDEWSTERVKLAYELIKSGMGKQAAKDAPCWINNLWHFCRKQQRLPDRQEAEVLRREAQQFDRSYQDCMRGHSFDSYGNKREIPDAKVLLKFGDSILAKRERLCAEALGQ